MLLPDFCKKCFCYDAETEDCGAGYEYPEDDKKCVHRKCHYCYYYQKINKKHKCILKQFYIYSGEKYYSGANKTYPALCTAYIEKCTICKNHIPMKDTYDNTIFTDCVLGTFCSEKDCKYEPVEIKERKYKNGNNP